MSFHAELIVALPRLRLIALAQTRNRAEADDLAQDAIERRYEAGTGMATP